LCKDNHCRFICDDFGFWIQDKITGNVLLKGLCSNGLYPIPFSVSSSSHTPFQLASASHRNQYCYLGQQVKSSLWHKRFGHPSNNITSTLLTQSQIPFTSDPTKSFCTICLKRKITKLPFSYPAVKSIHPLEIIHSDVWGPAPTMSVEGFRYYVSFVDECTLYTWIFPMINKGEVYSIFVHFHAFLVTQFSVTLGIFQSDGGGEYISTNFKNYLLTKGIVHQLSCLYTPEQNGLAERKHRHIVETAITLLQTAHLPNKFWFHACATSIYFINRLPCQILQLKSHFFLLYGSSPVIHHLRIFGCACFPLLRPYNTHKLQPKTFTCIFLGYAGQYKGYICFSLHANHFFVSRHVLFDESLFPYTCAYACSLSFSACACCLSFFPLYLSS
jgi:histone deacetylase 1/2